MIYELRVYAALPGKMSDLLKLLEKVLPVWERYGIRQGGFWTPMVGPSSQEVTYFLLWESLADREVKWSKFLNDAEWAAIHKDSEKGGPLTSNVSTSFLRPTAFSVSK